LTRSGRIILLLGLNIIMFLAELIVGYKTGSLALIADAFHMLSDVLSQVIALYAIRLAAKTEWQPTLSYGWQRAELLGALYNGVFLLALCFTILLDAIERFFKPEDIEDPKLVLVVGGIGLVCNLMGLVLFHDHSGHGHSHGGHSHGHSHSSKKPKAIASSPDEGSDDEKGPKEAPSLRHQSSLERISPLKQANIQNLQQAALEVQQQIENEERYAQQDAEETRSRNSSFNEKEGEDLNMQGIFLHVLGDALGSVGVIFTALFIWLTDFSWRFYMDPIISVCISAIIIHSALPLVRSASFILLQGVPVGVEIEEIRREIKAIPDVISIHDLHIWQLTNIKMVASLHVLVTNQEAFERVSRAVKSIMHRAGVHSTTIQPEF
ncbi:MAG: cation efflux protein, partial [Podila humilis]